MQRSAKKSEMGKSVPQVPHEVKVGGRIVGITYLVGFSALSMLAAAFVLRAFWLLVPVPFFTFLSLRLGLTADRKMKKGYREHPPRFARTEESRNIF